MGTKLTFLSFIAVDERKLPVPLCAVYSMSTSTISNALNDHASKKTIYPKLEACLKACLEKWKKNKCTEAYVSSTKAKMNDLHALSQLATPSKVVTTF